MFSEFDLHPRLQAGLDAAGFDVPTDVQQQVIPVALEGRDTQVCAETGSGKTLAYLLPMMQRLLENRPLPGAATRALIVLPTRELADQVFKAARLFCKLTSLEVGLVCGGAEFQYQAALFRKNPEIIVATPGRLVDHLKRGTCDLSDVEVLVLDEADRMMDMGFSEDMTRIVSSCCGHHQTFLLSATLRHEGVNRLVKGVMETPVEITTRAVNEQHELIHQQRILADDAAHKDRLLVWLLANEVYDKAIVFVNRRDDVERLGEFLRRHRQGIAQLHGEMTQDERRFIMQQLRDGRRQILVATDVAARGLDISDLSAVINYDLPFEPEVYVHRIGRTGRAGKEGQAFSIFTPKELPRLEGINILMSTAYEPSDIADLKPTTDAEVKPSMVTFSINGGKKNKLRPGDILGALTKEAGIAGSSVGKINCFDYYSYVAIERSMANKAEHALSTKKIKGRSFIIHRHE